jgi:hypothetical protein
MRKAMRTEKSLLAAKTAAQVQRQALLSQLPKQHDHND